MYKEISDTKKSQVITEGEIIMTKNILKNKIDFVAFISVRGANPNGDPNNENLPRTDDEMYGEMSSGCIHRKIRNRMQDMGHKIYVQSEERTDDGYVCLSDRAKALFSEPNNIDKCREEACEKWLDVRAFGQVFALPKGNVSFGVRGPVTTHEAYSIDPVVIDTYGITKSVNACRRTTRYGKKWVCNAKDRKGMAACDFRDIYEIELEAAATKALAVNEFKEDLVRREVKRITIDNAYIVFDLKDGKKKQILRTYTKGYSGFSCRLFCGNCCKMLEADSRTLSINGQKKRYKIWCCRKCPGQREFDDVIRKATQSLFNEPQCEGLFAQNIEKAIIYNDRIDFYFKERKVITWEKE